MLASLDQRCVAIRCYEMTLGLNRGSLGTLKELESGYHTPETALFAMYPCDGNLHVLLKSNPRKVLGKQGLELASKVWG